IGVEKIRKLQQPLRNALADCRGPYNSNGSGNQGYLFEFSWEALAILLDITTLDLPDELKQWLPEVDITIEEDPALVPEIENPLPSKHTEAECKTWLPKVQQFMASKGFDFSLPDVTNFYLALRTKPLVILAGISGTGKTQLVRQFAKAIGYGDERHCVLIPVRPDWADNSDLVGYRNIQGQFEQQKLLKVLQDALAHPDEPFFVILDEMNLARVEHYFSDFLSVLETRERNTDNVILTNPVVTDSTVNRGVPVTIPQNLMIVGTVNMDETTHPFSRKVLDRANAIELNEVSLPWRTTELNGVSVVTGIYSDSFVVPYLNSIELSEAQKQALQPVIELLVKINNLLEPAGLHFGYRVRDEVAFYMTQFEELDFSADYGMTMDDALDYQLMQKVLPRIQGSSMAVLTTLLMLLKEFSGASITTEMEYTEVEKILNELSVPHKYPRSVNKLLFMLRRFNEDGFTSFWL
ncbi:MAG: AAA family ATPase, partial [Methylococcales bacterium]